MKDISEEIVEIIYEGQVIKVSKEIADFLFIDELYMLAQQKKKQRYISNIELVDGFIEKLMKDRPDDVIDAIIQKLDIEKLREAIDGLSDIQKRRIIAYFFEGFTFRVIAENEKVNEKSVRQSISSAIKKIKNNF